MGSKQSKIRPLYPALLNDEYAIRVFKPLLKGKKAQRPFSVIPAPADKVECLFAIKYNPSPDSAPRGELIVNGNPVSYPAGVVDALISLETHARAIMGLTSGWTPCFYLDALCINFGDREEVENLRAMEPYIFSKAMFVLDLTEAKARIFQGATAYVAPVINIDGSFGSSLNALNVAVDNKMRVNGHQARQLIWTER